MGAVVDNPHSVRESTRDNLDCKINLRQDTVDRLSKDSSLKVMVYCASEPMSPFNQVDISFPHSIEIRINLDEIKSNLRGLKNKPGSTRPADITPLLRKRAGYDNSMRITYALTNKVGSHSGHRTDLFKLYELVLWNTETTGRSSISWLIWSSSTSQKTWLQS